MRLKQFIKRVTPKFIIAKARLIMQKRGLSSVRRLTFKTDVLRSTQNFALNEILESSEIDKLWGEASEGIDFFNIPDFTGGVNPGDRRALFYLISGLKPGRVLEIGTHIGASTINIASALYYSQVKNGDDSRLTTLDIRDVNSTETKPWLNFGTKMSPLEMIKKLNFSTFVQFLTGKSLDYLESGEQQFDLIFLDGDHAAKTVYQEVSTALHSLNPNGIIVLHDYFPNMQPLWSNGVIKRGPFLAIDRIIKEGGDLVVVPLGGLPWPTKLNSNVTSLALLLKKS